MQRLKGAKNWGKNKGKGCTYIKDWLKPIFPLFPI
jgi:hypothetical protein